jgi:hypothetical protein
MLIVQFPSVLHEMALEAITEPFAAAKYKLMCDTGLSNWAILRGRENKYQDMPKAGAFIADASFDMGGKSMFHIEIAFSQTWDNLHAKIKRILKNETILAVLAMNICESGTFRSPTRRPKPNDFIHEGNWFKDAIASQNRDPFRRIVVDGHTWMWDITIDMRLCKRAQEDAGGDLQIVCLSH